MKNHKRIILVGPTASGKNFIRDAYIKAGFKSDVSYTSREPRENEIDGVDYHFISKKEFQERIDDQLFYEWVEYGDNMYGTGRYEWENSDIFIMETDGITHILPTDRKNCLVIYVNTPMDIRIKRMKERGWDNAKVYKRIIVDQPKFKDFKDYDLEITSGTYA